VTRKILSAHNIRLQLLRYLISAGAGKVEVGKDATKARIHQAGESEALNYTEKTSHLDRNQHVYGKSDRVRKVQTKL
jgi:hypothetical protein